MVTSAKPAKPVEAQRKIALSGVKPTGTPHIGNYLGMIRPALELIQDYDTFYFMADYHALTTIRDRDLMSQYTYEVAATFLALGLDPERAVFYRQSDVPEIFELTWVLSCFAGKGWLNRAHAYKAAVDANTAEGGDPDDGVTMGLYNYPVLMAADILMFHSHFVPVGRDQKQHIEIARDIASGFNHIYGNILTLPEALIRDEVATVPGLDGRKMSKSYGNTIEIFAPSKQLRKQVMRIVTDSRTPEEPKDPETSNIFNIYRHFASPEQIAANRQKYLQGGTGYGDLKKELFELLEATFAEPRRRYNDLLANKAEIDQILAQGAEKARAVASPLMAEIRRAIGISR